MSDKNEVFHGQCAFRFTPNGEQKINEKELQRVRESILSDFDQLIEVMLTPEEREQIKRAHTIRVKASSEVDFHIASTEWVTETEGIQVNASHIKYVDQEESSTIISIKRGFCLDEENTMVVRYSQQRSPRTVDENNGYSVEIRNKRGALVAELFIYAVGENIGFAAISQQDEEKVEKLVHTMCEVLHIDRGDLNRDMCNAEIVHKLGNVIFRGLYKLVLRKLIMPKT